MHSEVMHPMVKWEKRKRGKKRKDISKRKGKKHNRSKLSHLLIAIVFGTWEVTLCLTQWMFGAKLVIGLIRSRGGITLSYPNLKKRLKIYK